MIRSALGSALLLALLSLVPRSVTPVAVAAVESVALPIVALPAEVSGEPIAPEFTGLPQDPEFVIPEIKLPEVPAAADPPKIDPEWVKSVYPVRMAYGVIGQQGSMTFDGCGVAVGPDKIHTAAHLTHQMPAGSRAEVLVDGEWKRANWSPVAGKDFSVAIVPGANLKPVPVRVPVYGERVTVYGLKTKSFAQGTYIGATDIKAGFGLVPLDACETPVHNGDSGGGVFGDDGCLLGTIRGLQPDSKLITTMTPIVADAPKATPCPGGVCPAPQAGGQIRTYFPRRRR
ncbi:trypsin-like peptidase domain-containing protein [Planctomyces sp. SH-PL14]|uniref:trypsin-like peptidase domain-containing protein n=1 Tax=Planctomyces sp. SH-PL14 TaxID=1632864 RepID=UPI00078E20E0|nr:trypsin-like peptidase domain-containing protein [Planctomyces sp. SH-PL14]AMV18246.1 hypothetical protein VT03_10180 [Planctomyces sp. SH-PL14]